MHADSVDRAAPQQRGALRQLFAELARDAARLLTAQWRPHRPFVAAVLTALGLFVWIPLLVWHGERTGNMDRWFHEGKPATILSGVILGAMAWSCQRFGRRRIGPPHGRFWGWLTVLAGVAAVDEIFKLHEHIEIWTHQILGMPRGDDSPLREIDSTVVLIYPVVATIVALRHRRHLMRFVPTLRWWAAAAACFVGMQLLDTYMVSVPRWLEGGQLLWEEVAKLGTVILLFAGVVAAVARRDVPVRREFRTPA